VTAYHSQFDADGNPVDPERKKGGTRGAIRAHHGSRGERVRPQHRPLHQAGRRRAGRPRHPNDAYNIARAERQKDRGSHAAVLADAGDRGLRMSDTTSNDHPARVQEGWVRAPLARFLTPNVESVGCGTRNRRTHRGRAEQGARTALRDPVPESTSYKSSTGLAPACSLQSTQAFRGARSPSRRRLVGIVRSTGGPYLRLRIRRRPRLSLVFLTNNAVHVGCPSGGLQEGWVADVTGGEAPAVAFSVIVWTFLCLPDAGERIRVIARAVDEPDHRALRPKRLRWQTS